MYRSQKTYQKLLLPFINSVHEKEEEEGDNAKTNRNVDPNCLEKNSKPCESKLNRHVQTVDGSCGQS